MATKVTTARKASTATGAFTATHAKAPADTVESLTAQIKDIDTKIKALLPKMTLGAATTATRAQSRQMVRLSEIEKQIADLTDGLHAEASSIRADLTAAIDSAGRCELIATSEGLRYCAEPRGASVQLRKPTIGHTLRTIAKK